MYLFFQLYKKIEKIKNKSIKKRFKVNEELSPFNLILVINSLFIVGLILNQNENRKDSTNKKNQNSSPNPLEKITWISVIIQFIFLLVKVKISNS